MSAQPNDYRDPVPALELGNYRHSDARLFADADRGLADLTRLVHALPGILDRLRDLEAGQPGAQNTEQDRTSGQTTRRWCFVHQTDHIVHGEPQDCAGVTVIPAKVDTTGESAIADDQARADERQLLRHVRAALTSIESAMQIAAHNTPRPASSIDRKRAAADNRRWCESCARVDNPITGRPREEWPHTDAPTTVAGRLPHAMRLCRWCYDQVIKTEEDLDGPRLPHLEELLLHHGRGKDPRRRLS